MWWPIRIQILIPFAAILMAAVTTIAVSSAFLAARRSERQTVAQLNQVIDTLGQSSFPYSANVLLQMRGLSGAEFVAQDSQGRILASTLPQTPALTDALRHTPSDDQLDSLAQYPVLRLDGTRYFAATMRRVGFPQTTTLLVLYPEKSWRQARWEAALPPLAVGAATVVLMIVVSAGVASRLSGRIRSVQKQVAAIAAGEFHQITVGKRRDEIQELAASVNQMGSQLRQMQQTIRQSERSQLLGQVAGGLAHQLRNAVTGARLAVQIHRRRCSTPSGDESLEVALRQLALTEEQIRGLLSLGRAEPHTPLVRELGVLVEEIALLVGPMCEHAHVDFQATVTGEAGYRLPDAEKVRTAVLNMTSNAIEAAGPGGQVQLEATTDHDQVTFQVRDNGPGPPEELAETLFDPFVTGKAEGVGLGLALAKRVAEEQGGLIAWSRENGQTHFRLELPRREGKTRTLPPRSPMTPTS